MIRILTPGFQTTLQDSGRPGYAHLGISASGAADLVALRLGNALVGNPAASAAMEMTMTGASLTATTDCLLAVTGAMISLEIDGKKQAMWRSFTLRSGAILSCGRIESGARAYICVRGGFPGIEFLGSASTHIPSNLGGLDGKQLKAQDELLIGAADLRQATREISQEVIDDLYHERTRLHVTSGPQANLFRSDALDTLSNSSYLVSEKSNRMGLRLDGPPLQLKVERELLTEGISLGAIQVSGGQPIISFVDHQTTGGYPKICNVISADMHKIGQLRPRDIVRFVPVTFGDAIRRLRRIEELLSPAISETA